MKWLSDKGLSICSTSANDPILAGRNIDCSRRSLAGGMGTVYRAEDTELKPSECHQSSEHAGSRHDVAKRMCAEAQIIARLEHPGLFRFMMLVARGRSRVLSMKLVRGYSGLMNMPRRTLQLRIGCENSGGL